MSNDAWAKENMDLKEWNLAFLAHTTLIAEIDEKMVGFADMDKAGCLDKLFIYKNFQRKGIAGTTN